jgi:hypothetical protein
LVEWTASWNVQESILSMLERIWVTSSWNMVYRRTLWHEHMRNVNQRQRTSARFLVGNKICRTWHLFILPSSCIRMLLIQRIHCCSPIYVQESICTIFRQKVSDFCCELELKQSEILSDEMFMQRYGARNSI